MEPTATYDNLVKGGRGRLRHAINDVKAFVENNSIIYLPTFLLLTSMNTVKSEMDNLMSLKSYERTGLTETVKASSLYKNANKLYEDAEHYLRLAGIQIWNKYKSVICCSYCNRESVRGNPCSVRQTDTEGHLPIIDIEYVKYNGPRTNIYDFVLGENRLVWPSKWVEVQTQGGCQTNGGHYTGKDLSITALKRDAQGQKLPSQVVSAIPWAKRDQL